MAEQNQQQNINIKINDDILKGAYSNSLMIAHNKEEFVMDFLNIWAPQGIVVSRIITSAGNYKRFVAALTENLKKYETQFGEIPLQKTEDAPANKTSTGEYKIGF